MRERDMADTLPAGVHASMPKIRNRPKAGQFQCTLNTVNETLAEAEFCIGDAAVWLQSTMQIPLEALVESLLCSRTFPRLKTTPLLL